MLRPRYALVLLLVGAPALAESPLTDEDWRSIDSAADGGLRYLATGQAGDGSFAGPSMGQPGITAIGVLAFLQHGHQPGLGPHGETLARAVDFMLACQKKQSGLFALDYPDRPLTRLPMANFMVSVSASYSHPITGLTLSEVYGGTGRNEERLKQAIERGIEATLVMQAWDMQLAEDEGGWRYLHRFTQNDADLSIVGWHLKFLRSAKNAGFEPPEKAIDAAVGYVRRCFTPELGTFEYKINAEDSRSRAMAGAGVLALAHAGRHGRTEAKAAAEWILRHGFTRYNVSGDLGDGFSQRDRYHYSLMYCTLAMYQMGGRYWDAFFPPTARTLLANQNADGSWPAEHHTDRFFGRGYTTSLVLIALGAPNQLLPIYQR